MMKKKFAFLSPIFHFSLTNDHKAFNLPPPQNSKTLENIHPCNKPKNKSFFCNDIIWFDTATALRNLGICFYSVLHQLVRAMPIRKSDLNQFGILIKMASRLVQCLKQSLNLIKIIINVRLFQRILKYQQDFTNLSCSMQKY